MPQKYQITSDKGKSFSSKVGQGSGPSKDVNATTLTNDDSNPDKDEIALLSKRFTIFLKKKKHTTKGVGKESSSIKGLKSLKIDDELDNEAEKPSKCHLNKIICFECENLVHISTNFIPKQKHIEIML